MNIKESFESRSRAIIEKLRTIANVFINGIAKIARVFQRYETRNVGHIKQFENQGLYHQMKTTFDSPIIHKRYCDIITALKYTKHSKKRERLLKAKRMYEKHWSMEELTWSLQNQKRLY